MRSALVCLVIPVLLAPQRLTAGERPPPAAPGGIKIDPVRVDLSKDDPAKSVTVSLGSGDPAGTRFQVSAAAWSNTEDGEIQLTPTDDVSFFPSLFVLKPLASRRIRVGVPPQAGKVERSYRLVLQQLPSGNGSSEAVQILTRMTLPIFVAPEKVVRAGAVADAILKDGTIRFSIRNDGTVHLMVPSAHVIARDATGAILLDKQEPGWYVLPGSLRHFTIQVPPDVCPKVTAISIEASEEKGGSFKQSAIFADQPCAKPASP